jgi:hypothetical protein
MWHLAFNVTSISDEPTAKGSSSPDQGPERGVDSTVRGTRDPHQTIINNVFSVEWFEGTSQVLGLDRRFMGRGTVWHSLENKELKSRGVIAFFFLLDSPAVEGVCVAYGAARVCDRPNQVRMCRDQKRHDMHESGPKYRYFVP